MRTQFTKGTVLLCEENGLAEVNFIPDDESNTVLEDVYESANKQLLGRNPTRIFSVNPNAYATFLKQELIFAGMKTEVWWPVRFLLRKSRR